MPVESKAAPYAIKMQKVVADDPANVIVVIYNTQTRRTVWKHHFPLLDKFAWSRDHRKLAFSLGHADTNVRIKLNPRNPLNSLRTVSILIWQAGRRQPIVYQKQLRSPFVDDFYYDSMYEMKWSPDAELLAFRTWTTQGDQTEREGFLWCFKPKTEKFQNISGRSLAMWWVSRRRLAFETLVMKAGNNFGSHISYWTWR